MRLHVTGEGQQVEVGDALHWSERAQKSGDFSRHSKTLGLYTQPRTKRIEPVELTTTARVSHRVGHTKDVADMQLWFAVEEGRHGMQIFKGALCSIIPRFLICKVKSGREGVGVEDDSGEGAEEAVKGGNGGNERHELERSDAVRAEGSVWERKGKEETMAVAAKANSSAVMVGFRRVHGDEEGGHGMCLTRGVRKRCCDSDEGCAVSVREAVLPPPKLTAHEGCRLNKCRRVRVPTQVVIQAMHP